jgi:hypothetical protein
MRKSAILGEALRLAGANAPAWFAAAALFTVPVALASPLAEAGVLPFWRPFGSGLGGSALRAFELFAQVVTTGVLVVFALRAHVGRKASWSATWNVGLGRIRPAITSGLASLLPVTGYMLLLVALPFTLAAVARLNTRIDPLALGRFAAIYIGAVVVFLSVLLVFVVPVAMLEGLGGFKGYGRGRALLRGNWRLVLPVMVPIFGIGFLATTGGYLFDGGWLEQLVRRLLQIAALPFEAAASLLLYLQVRAGREGREASDLAREIDAQLVPGVRAANLPPQTT